MIDMARSRWPQPGMSLTTQTRTAQHSPEPRTAHYRCNPGWLMITTCLDRPEPGHTRRFQPTISCRRHVRYSAHGPTCWRCPL